MPHVTQRRPMNAVMAAAEFELTPEDWQEMQAFHLGDSSIQREATRNARVLGAALFVTLALLCLLMGFATGGVLFGTMALVFPVILGPLQEHANRKALEKMTEEGIANGMFGRHRIEVRTRGLFHATDTYESLYRWHGIEEVKERDGNFLIYIGAHAFIPIPSTAFPDSASLRRFSASFYDGLGTGVTSKETAALPGSASRDARPDDPAGA